MARRHRDAAREAGAAICARLAVTVDEAQRAELAREGYLEIKQQLMAEIAGGADPDAPCAEALFLRYSGVDDWKEGNSPDAIADQLDFIRRRGAHPSGMFELKLPTRRFLVRLVSGRLSADEVR